MELHKYYSIERPIGPGTFPATKDVFEICDFGERKYIAEIDRPAWGYINYKRELTADECGNYELVRGNGNGD